MKNAGMAGAVALVGIGLITIGMSNFANRAEAVPSAVANAGPGEPVIVAFGSLGLGSGTGVTNPSTLRTNGGFYRLWSDERLEVRLLLFERSKDVAQCGSNAVVGGSNCGSTGPFDSGWIELPASASGNGFACRSDINGDRNIDAEDLGLLLAGWGQKISCDPQPSYPCFDLNGLNGLNGLNMNIAAR